MELSLAQWQYPIGNYHPKATFTAKDIKDAITVLKTFPKALKETLAACDANDLKQPYRPGGWTIQQLVHHIADSHMHSYMRCKYAFLEDTPTIKGYAEKDWVEKSPDATAVAVEASVKILEGVHQRWAYFFEQLSDEELKRAYDHPEREENFPLAEVVYFYAWHSKHHLAHIQNYLKHKV